VVDGQFSMPFVASVALRTGGFAWDDYARHLSDPATLALCRKVKAKRGCARPGGFPAEMSGNVRITTPRGAFERYVRTPKGEPGNFLTAAELRAKFDGLAGPYLPARRCDELAGALLALEQVKDVGALLRLARPGETGGRRAA
jgi:2-methylcitrate dehydratase PrpD